MKQPIGVGIYSSGMMQSYSHGIMTEQFLHCSDPAYEVNHGVVLVGFGKVEQGDYVAKGHCDEYWIVRNSWSAHWGEDGFFKLCMDGAGTSTLPHGTCLVNSFAAWPTL